MNQIELIVKADEALAFLNQHPAVNCPDSGSFMTHLCWWIEHQCKNGVSKNHEEKAEDLTVRIYADDSKYEKFKQFETDEDREETDPVLRNIEVPYKVIYGEEWKLHKCVYVGEYSIYKYGKYDDPDHNIYCKLIGEKIRAVIADFIYPERIRREQNYPSQESFVSYDGHWSTRGCIHGDTFEEMIINIAKDVKENYGVFKFEDFLTDAEKDNHNTVDIFDRENRGNGIFNPDYIHIKDFQLNQRWWSWFRTTKYYQEHWLGE